MLDTQQSFYKNTAFHILDDIARSDTNTDEHESLVNYARTFIGEQIGITRNNIHFVPLYGKSQLKKLLETYYDEISIYKNDYDRLQDSVTSNDDFIAYAEKMHKIYVDSDIAEAQTAFDQSISAVKISETIYLRFRDEYNDSRDTLEEAREVFEQGIEGAELAVKFGLRSFVTGIVRVIYGLVKTDWDQIGTGIGEIINGTQTEITDPMEELARIVNQIDLMARQADDMMKILEDINSDFDYEMYADDVEIMVAMQMSVVQWTNLKDQATLLLASPDILEVSGSKGYALALMDLANWGEAITKAMVERAELIRQAMEKRSILETRQEKKVRIDKAIQDMKDDVSNRESLLAAMTEQSYDVRLDLNEALLLFCRAYFYENLAECKPSYRPAFGEGMTNLLLRINSALRDGMFTGKWLATVSSIVALN